MQDLIREIMRKNTENLKIFVGTLIQINKYVWCKQHLASQQHHDVSVFELNHMDTCTRYCTKLEQVPGGGQYHRPVPFLNFFKSMTMILGKINGPWNIGHWPTYILQGWFWVTLIHYPKYNISPSNSLKDMKQNRWTIKYRSLTYMYIYLIRSICMTHWSIIPTMMFIHQIILKILSKITRPWNIGHVDLYLLWGQSLGHTVSLSENMTLMHQIVLEI